MRAQGFSRMSGAAEGFCYLHPLCETLTLMKFCFYTTLIVGILNLLIIVGATVGGGVDGAINRGEDLVEVFLELSPLIGFGLAGLTLLRCSVIIKRKIKAIEKKKQTGSYENSE